MPASPSPSASPSPTPALRCPGCGATAPPDATRCAYCAGTLAVVACPACFAANVRGSRFCASCGTATSRAAEDPVAGPCPRCSGPLGGVRVGDVTLHECAACAGAWLDARVFAALCADRERRAALARHVTAAPTGAVDVERVRYVACPECRRLMNRVNVARISGVIVDLCRSHGAWLDAGELARLVAFLDAGGMDRARAREREQLADERRRLELQRSGTARERHEAYLGGTHPGDAGDLVSLLLAALRR